MPLLLDRNVRELRDGDRKIAVPVDALGRQRFLATTQVRTKGEPNEDGSIPFLGHASVFNKRTLIGSKRWGFWEEIAPNSFTKTISEADVRFLKNHNPDWILARSRPGKPSTLRLSQDDVGLVTDADMAPVSYALDLAISMGREDINQMSFAFDPIEYTIGEADDGLPLYTVTEARLYDVSVVTYPAYEDADAGLRGAGFDALCRANGWDPRAKLEEMFTMQRSDESTGAIDDGDEGHEAVTIQCVNCNTINPDGAKFCNACGASTGAPDAADNSEIEGEGDGARSIDIGRAQLRMAQARLAATAK